MTNVETLRPGQHKISTIADADLALKTIAVAEAAETLWARAKDTAQLFEAIKTKLLNQAAYAVWRQDVAVPSQTTGGHGRISELKSGSLPPTDPGDVTIHRWRARLCHRTETKRWDIDEVKIGGALDDAHKRAVRICEQQNMGTIRGTEGTGEFERYTPSYYIEKAREVLGAIDLDPATSQQAQETIGAKTFYTVEDDGLALEWHGRIWLNPPYHRELAPKFIDKLIVELSAGRVSAAIMLTNNATDTEWFRAAVGSCSAICFTFGRIHFEVPGAEPVMPTQGQAFFYFGPDVAIFTDVFSAVGFCMRPV